MAVPRSPHECLDLHGRTWRRQRHERSPDPLTRKGRSPTVDGPTADLGGVRAVGSAVILAPVQAALAVVAARHRVGGPAGQQLVQFRPARPTWP
jgi:hypothetical protein